MERSRADSIAEQQLPHICFLTPNAYPMLAKETGVQFAGGAELQQVILAKGLAKLGYPVSMICMDFGQDDQVEIDGVIVHRALRPKGGLPVLRFIWPRITSIWRCMNRANADIYCHRSASMLTGVMAYYCRRHGKKSVFAVAGENKIRIGRDRWLFEFGLRRVDRIVVQNLDQQRAIEASVDRDSLLIPNCFQAASYREERQQSDILWVGAIRQVKRPDLFLQLASSVPGYRFTMVGGPATQERSLYSEIEKRAELIPNVKFVGFVPYAKIDRYFDDAILFVNTSDSEGFPNTFLQSWSRGVPTVSLVDSGAQLNGERIGCVANSINEMRESIVTLMEDDTERRLLGERCKEYVEKEHAPEVVLRLYQDIFEGLQQEMPTKPY